MNIDEIQDKMNKLRRDRKSLGNNVLSVRYLGKIATTREVDGAKQEILIDIYKVLERFEKNGNKIEAEKYFCSNFETGKSEILAGNVIGDGRDKILINSKSEYSKDIDIKTDLEAKLTELEALNARENSGIELDIAEAEREDIEYENALNEIAKALGLDPSEIDSITQMDIEQQIEKDREERDSDEKERSEDEEERKEGIVEEIESNNDNENKQNEEKEELSEKQTEELTKVSGKQEVDINSKFDGKNTLRNELGLEGDISYISVVYSEKLKNVNGEINSSPFAFVAVRNDGTAKVIDSLELDHSIGSIPTKESIKIDADGTAKEDNATLSRYKVNGKNSYLSVQRAAYGDVTVYREQKTIEENKSVAFQLQTNKTRYIPREIKELQSPKRGEYNIDNIENEFEKHAKYGEKELKNKEDFDGDKETATHVHEEENAGENYVNLEKEIDNWTKEIMEDESVNEKLNSEEVKTMIENYLHKDKKDGDYMCTPEEAEKEFKSINEKIHDDLPVIKTMDSH